jgi:hypothetical protein
MRFLQLAFVKKDEEVVMTKTRVFGDDDDDDFLARGFGDL